MNSNFIKKVIIFCFIAVPLLSSIISTIHLVDLFYLGNPTWISYTVAVAIEIGAVASFLTLSILSRLNKTIVWSMFILLFFMQVIGNIYFSYDWISKKLIEDSLWISNFKEMLEFFSFEIDEKTSKMVLSMIIGIPIPLISVFLLKSVTDYIGNDSNDSIILPSDKSSETIHIKDDSEIKTESINEEKKEEKKEIHISENLVNDRNRLHPARY